MNETPHPGEAAFIRLPRVPSSGGRGTGVRAVRDAVHPAARARPVLLGPLPDGVEPRARRRGRRPARRDRLVGHRDVRGGQAARRRRGLGPPPPGGGRGRAVGVAPPRPPPPPPLPPSPPPPPAAPP